MNLSDFYSYSFRSSASGIYQWTLPLPPHRVRLTTDVKVGSTLTKVATLRVNLNLGGTPITSRTHTHPSHSQRSGLLTSSWCLYL